MPPSCSLNKSEANDPPQEILGSVEQEELPSIPEYWYDQRPPPSTKPLTHGEGEELPPTPDLTRPWWWPTKGEEQQKASLREGEKERTTPHTTPWNLNSREQVSPESRSREWSPSKDEAEEASSAACSRRQGPQSRQGGRKISAKRGRAPKDPWKDPETLLKSQNFELWRPSQQPWDVEMSPKIKRKSLWSEGKTLPNSLGTQGPETTAGSYGEETPKDPWTPPPEAKRPNSKTDEDLTGEDDLQCTRVATTLVNTQGKTLRPKGRTLSWKVLPKNWKTQKTPGQQVEQNMKVSIHQNYWNSPDACWQLWTDHTQGLHPEVLSGKEQIELLKIKKLLEDPRISRG